MTITITAFERSPDGGKGLARDTRVRWALEEVGQPYGVRLVSFAAMKEPPHLALHSFGQIPTYEEGDLAIFETGAIVFHIAGRYAGLLPADADARARAITWIFAALNTVEPPILEFGTASFFERDKPWFTERLPLVVARLHPRLAQLSASPRRCGLARRRLQRGRPDDGISAAEVASVGCVGRVSEAGRVRRTRRKPAGLRAGVRSAIGRQYGQGSSLTGWGQHFANERRIFAFCGFSHNLYYVKWNVEWCPRRLLPRTCPLPGSPEWIGISKAIPPRRTLLSRCSGYEQRSCSGPSFPGVMTNFAFPGEPIFRDAEETDLISDRVTFWVLADHFYQHFAIFPFATP